MFDKILVTCVGNICRSPMASAVLKAKLGEKVKVQSAGIGALHGRKADPIAIKLMKRREIKITNHRARSLNKDDVSEASIIFAMEKRHVDFIKKTYPQSRGKFHLLGKWIGDSEVPDPYKKRESEFSYSLEIIEKSIDRWVKIIDV